MKFSSMSAAISVHGAASRAAPSPSIRAAFRTGRIPGTIMASKDAQRTEELAVMFDTQHTLELTEEALALDDPKYPLSWLD